jgi:alanine dehydrogenase
MDAGTRILTQRDVARVVDVRLAIRVVREAFRAMARGEAVMPPKVYLSLARHGDFRAMPAWIRRPSAAGLKWVNVHPDNPRRGLPTVMGLIIINDPATGAPWAILDGLLITQLRTAAAGAVAARALARPNSRVVGLLGCGGQAPAQLLALHEVLRLRHIKVWGYHPGEAQRFCRQMRRRLPRVRFDACATVESCVRDVDVLVTLTPSKHPLVKRAWLRDGVHINAMGADAPGKQELDPQILRDALVVVDEREQSLHGGELNVPVRKGQFRPRQIYASLGDILIGRKRHRRAPQEITVFDSTGLAIHDVALGAAAFHRARQRRIGHRLRFFSPSAV